MKCQKCGKLATFHITELTNSKPVEHHLCEEHARDYLSNSSGSPEPVGNLAAMLSKGSPKPVSVGKAADELKELDQQTCPVCGMSFYEFRQTGRLGCPNDYDYFPKQLEALILNIHGETQHIGKVPKRAQKGTNRKTLLIKLRRDLEDAVLYEDYERAAVLRDKIKEMETECQI
jgi:protein arginine kinase activator